MCTDNHTACASTRAAPCRCVRIVRPILGAITRRSRKTPILSQDRNALPPRYRLDSATADFVSRGDLRSVITLVEAWRDHGEVSHAGELAQAKALAALGQHDRAWARLRPLLDGGTAIHDTFVTAAELLLDRGWYREARAVIARGCERYTDSAALFALQSAASEERTEPEIDPRELDTKDVEAGLSAVMMWFAHGQQLRATSMLERLARRSPDHQRIQLLLWAAAGDYRLDGSIGDLLAASAPELSFLADLPADGEHTESVPAHELPVETRDNTEHSAFKSLFRNLDDSATQSYAQSDPDVTAITSLADLQARRPVDDTTDGRRRTDDASHPDRQTHSGGESHDTDGRGDDTQIMRVVRKDGEIEPTVGKIHDTTPDVTGSFDLATYRKELGIDGDFAPSAEQEDEDVVVVTRANRVRPDPSAQSTEVQGVKLHHEALAPTSARKLRLENEDWARPATADRPGNHSGDEHAHNGAHAPNDDEVEAALPELEPDQTPAPPPPRRSSVTMLSRAPTWTWWLLTFLLIVAFAAVAALVFLAVLMSS